PLGRSDLDETAPRGVGIGGHARSVEENTDRVTVEGVLNEYVVVGGNEEIVPGGDAADSELDAVGEQLLLVGHVHESVGLASEDLLHGEDVADVFFRKAGAEALRKGNLERAALELGQLPEIEQQIDARLLAPLKPCCIPPVG